MGNAIIHSCSDPYECPICYNVATHMIKLTCRHRFDLYCIQKHLVTCYNNEIIPCCPYCRKELYCELRKILKKWSIIDYRCTDTKDMKNEFNFTSIYDKINIHKISKINVMIDNTKGQVIVPFFNNTYIPIFFNQHEITIQQSYDTLPFKQISNNFEVMNFSNGCILECFVSGNHWNKFLYNIMVKNSQIYKLFVKYYDIAIIDLNNISDVYMLFYIKNKDDIICGDTSTGDIHNKLIIMNKKCNILYRTYFVIHNNKFHIINEVYRIIYYAI